MTAERARDESCDVERVIARSDGLELRAGADGRIARAVAVDRGASRRRGSLAAIAMAAGLALAVGFVAGRASETLMPTPTPISAGVEGRPAAAGQPGVAVRVVLPFDGFSRPRPTTSLTRFSQIDRLQQSH